MAALIFAGLAAYKASFLVFRIRGILVRFRMPDLYHWITDPDPEPDPTFFFIHIQDVNKFFFVLYLLYTVQCTVGTVDLHQPSKITSV